MFVIMKSESLTTKIERIIHKISCRKIDLEKCVGIDNTVISLVGNTASIAIQKVERFSSFIERVVYIDKLFTKMVITAISTVTDSLMIEVYPNPAKTLSNGVQSLTLQKYQELMVRIISLTDLFNRGLYKNFPNVPSSFSKQLSKSFVSSF